MIEDFQVWNIYQWGIFGYASNHVTIDGFVDLGDPSVAAGGWGGTGLWFSDYFTEDLTVNNANFQDLQVGIMAPVNTAGMETIQNSYFRNQCDIEFPGLWSVSYTPDLPGRTLIISNDKFDNFSYAGWDGQSLYINMLYGGSTRTKPTRPRLQLQPGPRGQFPGLLRAASAELRGARHDLQQRRNSLLHRSTRRGPDQCPGLGPVMGSPSAARSPPTRPREMVSRGWSGQSLEISVRPPGKNDGARPRRFSSIRRRGCPGRR